MTRHVFLLLALMFGLFLVVALLGFRLVGHAPPPRRGGLRPPRAPTATVETTVARPDIPRPPRSAHPSLGQPVAPPEPPIPAPLLTPVSSPAAPPVASTETPGPSSVPEKRSRFEAALAADGKRLLRFSPKIRSGTVSRSLVFDRSMLDSHELYLAPTDAEDAYVHVDSSGVIRTEAAELGSVDKVGELLFTAAAVALFADGRPVGVLKHGWSANWVTTAAKAPPTRSAGTKAFRMEDHFMRSDLAEGACRIAGGGSVRPAQRGGGMAATREEELDFTFQRAVNPFSVFAENGGGLSYDIGSGNAVSDLCAEARFYFGVPKTGDVVDTRTVPVDTDMLVTLGPMGGNQIAFGWRGELRAFALLTRSGDGGWQVIERRSGKRPAITNWVRIGLVLRSAHVLEAQLDGVTVLRRSLPFRVAGPLRILSGEGLVEFDDVLAQSLPAEADPGTPLCVKSRQFAGKLTKVGSDRPQFREWSESVGAFRHQRWHHDRTDTSLAGIVTSAPLMGNFTYEAIPFCDTSGRLPLGDYRVNLYRPDNGDTPDLRTSQAVFSLAATRTEDAWTFRTVGDTGKEHRQFVLRLARRGDRVELDVAGEWTATAGGMGGPLHLAVVRFRKGERRLFSPSPNHHPVRSNNLVHEFFEGAPTDWSWVDGAFRMDCRWACQDQWNFMACGSPGLPWMASKRTFAGDQLHEYFVSLRSVFPWDAGDARFQYDPEADQANDFKILNENHAWYNRRDLNFSFCSDGRNPLSGYSMLFGADDNAQTRLLRKGVVVADTRRSTFRFPTATSHHAVHWQWWKFTVRIRGGRILVHLDDKPVFDYADPEPLAGGHVGFWSVRNGFSLSRVTSVGERIDWDPHVLYVNEDTDSSWSPLLHDVVTLDLDPASGRTRVTNGAGGGFFAARYVPPSPVSLRETPVLELPFSCSADVSVALHLYIDERSYIVPINHAAITGMKSLLTPEYETGECFRLPTLAESTVRSTRDLGTVAPADGLLRIDLLSALTRLGVPASDAVLTVLTIGNTSNTDYALAGNLVNRAGASYVVGEPVFTER